MHVNKNTTEPEITSLHQMQCVIMAKRGSIIMAVAHQLVLQNIYDCGIGYNVQGKAGEILPELLDVTV